jgi:hypothetical protein
MQNVVRVCCDGYQKKIENPTKNVSTDTATGKPNNLEFASNGLNMENNKLARYRNYPNSHARLAQRIHEWP